MPYQTKWLVEKRVFDITYSDELSTENFEQLILDVNAKIKEGIAPIHVVDDLRGMENLPANHNLMSQLANELRGEKFGWAVLIQDSSVVQFIATVLVQMIGIKMTNQDSVEEALDFLRRQDSTLPAVETVH